MPTLRKDPPLITARWFNQDGTPTRVFFDYLRTLKSTVAFESSEQAITAATNTTVAHGLAAKPKLVSLYLINKTTEYDYAVGDEVLCPAFEDTSDYGASVAANATNVIITVGANGIRIPRRDAGNIGQYAGITTANWRLIARAVE